LAEEAGLAKPMTKRRVVELTEALLSKLPGVTTDHSVTGGVAKVIQNRCELSLKRARFLPGDRLRVFHSFIRS
jgi:hypothetical protein